MDQFRKVRCKMRCQGVVAHSHQADMSIVTLGAVWSPATGTPEDENAVFGKLTPYGSINVAMVNEAASLFELSKSYYVDFEVAPD